MSDNIIVKSNIKNVVPESNIAGDFADALNEKVKTMIKEAVKRAEANSRKTVMAKDL